ncbi:DNA glycosylase [Rhizoctonia solani]|nr:DNA glycosylase [Rhizoctonia solani]
MTSVFKSIKLPVAQLNLKAVLKCGQSFRWTMVPLDPIEQDLIETKPKHEAKPHDMPTEEWRLTLEDRVVCLRQTTTELFYRAHFPVESTLNTPSDDQDSTLLWIREYFQLDIDLQALYADWSKRDPVFQKVAPRFVGIRILRQDPWENLVSFICSQNNHISRITSMVHSLCIHFSRTVCSSSELPGSPLDASWHSFPPPEALANPNVEARLRELGFGYRAKYIQKTAAMLCEKHKDPIKALLELRQLSTSEARVRLLEFHGVGPKVADCILLMSLNKTEVVPVDTHVQQIATKMYGFRSQGKQPKAMNPRLYSEIASKFTDTWGSYAGWAHSVLFTADLKSFANFGLDSVAVPTGHEETLPLPSPAPVAEKPPLDEQPVSVPVKSEGPSQKPVLRKRKPEPGSNSNSEVSKEEAQGVLQDTTLAERVKRRRRPVNYA